MKTPTLFTLREHLEELEQYLTQIESGEAYAHRPGLLGALRNLRDELGRVWTFSDEFDDIRERLKSLTIELAADSWHLEAAQLAIGAAILVGEGLSKLEQAGGDGDEYPRALQKVAPEPNPINVAVHVNAPDVSSSTRDSMQGAADRL